MMSMRRYMHLLQNGNSIRNFGCYACRRRDSIYFRFVAEHVLLSISLLSVSSLPGSHAHLLPFLPPNLILGLTYVFISAYVCTMTLPPLDVYPPALAHAWYNGELT